MYKTAEELLENKTFKQIKQPMPRYLTDGAIDANNGRAILLKGSAGAYTLAAPTPKQEGIELTIINGTAFAHVLTATGLIDNGVIGGSKNTATFGAFVGSSISLVALNSKWAVVALNVVTVA